MEKVAEVCQDFLSDLEEEFTRKWGFYLEGVCL